MVVPTSKYFRANLGKLDQATQSRVEEWARNQCDAYKVAHTALGDLELYAQRSAPKTCKSHKMAVRAVFQNWGIPLDGAAGDWLVLLSTDNFADAGAGEPTGAENAQSIAASLTPRTRNGKPPALTWDRQPPTPHEIANAVVLTRLSEDFDQRSIQSYKALFSQTNRETGCA